MSRAIKEPIPKAVVDAVWRQAATATPQEARTWLEDLMQRQPALDHYLFAADEHYSPSDSRGLIFLTGFLIWQAMSQNSKIRRQVNPKDLEAAHKASQNWIYELEAGAHLTRCDLLERLSENCRQKALWKSVLATLMEESSIANDLQDSSRRLALLHLKTVLDCLDNLAAEAEAKAIEVSAPLPKVTPRNPTLGTSTVSAPSAA
jgi:hypothetical protein